MALLLPLLLPLPLNTRSGALAQLQSKLATQLLHYLGTSLERVVESERACQVRWGQCLCCWHGRWEHSGECLLVHPSPALRIRPLSCSAGAGCHMR